MAIPISFEGDELERDALARLAHQRGTTCARLVRDALINAYPELHHESLRAPADHDDPFTPGRRGPGRPRKARNSQADLTQHYAARVRAIASELKAIQAHIHDLILASDDTAAQSNSAYAQVEGLSRLLNKLST